MAFLDRLAQKRLDQITSYAREHLDSDEHVRRWVRAKNPDGRGDGFIYLTEKHVVIHWRGRAESPGAIALPDITSWGLDSEATGGPLLGIEATEQVVFVKLPVETRVMAEHATDFVTEFARWSPEPESDFTHGRHHGDFKTDGDVLVEGRPKPISAHARRVGVTVIGVLLVTVGGVLSLPGLPGPGLLIVLAGLGVLASEYDWAKDVLDWAREKYRVVAQKIKSRRNSA